MKRLEKILALLLVMVMCVALFTGCESKKERLAAKQAELCDGKWLNITADSEEQAVVLLENIDLYEGEIAVVDTTNLKYARIMEYSMTGMYRQYISVEHTKVCVRDFYEETFASLYENRAAIDDLYDAALTDMTEEEFQLFYAGLYSYDDFDALLDYFTEIAYKYDWEDLEVGTYSLDDEDTLSILREAEGWIPRAPWTSRLKTAL